DGFDEHFAPAYYEDTDLCFRVRRAGHRVVVQPLSRVVHLEGQTHGTSTSGPGLKRHQVLNRRKFAERWRDTLAAHRLNGDSPALEAARHALRHAVFIDDTLPTPDEDAGSQAAFQHMRALMRLGYQISFVPAHNMARRSPHAERLQRLGIECIYQPYFGSVEEYLRRRSTPVDLIYLHRVGNASPYLGLVRRLHPTARVVFNVADLHHLRLARQAEVGADAALAATAQRLREEELAAVRGADVTLVHSHAERDLLAQIAPEGRVAVVPWSYAPRRLVSPVPRQGVVFVGGYRHSPNVDAAQWLVREVMPRVWQRLPELTCTLVGSHMPAAVLALAAPRVEVAGHVADLAPIYARRLVAVAPLRYGAGIKGKVLEALACGLPCVMTPIAAEGLALDRTLASLVAEDAEGLAAIIVALHEDPDWHEAAAESGLELIRQHYSDEALDAALLVCLGMALSR
ncbi:MAG TPA: glycosyltransferase, partial [Ideonella sp.]|nr:glycosyltransferase [Ideonella sp.]